MVNKLSLLEGFPKERLSEGDIVEFGEAARLARQWVLTMTTAANSGHPAGSLSGMEIYLVTYAVSSLRPHNADSLDRDFVVISHGHTSPGAYAALAYYGFFSPEELLGNFRRAGSPFEGHVERGCPGIDWGTGNLGQGLAAGVGFALAMKARGARNHVYVLMGDGEQVKGQVAEARRIANKEKLGSITAIIDYNHIQISGRVEEIMPANIAALWKADGWLVYECDGHDVDARHHHVVNTQTGKLDDVQHHRLGFLADCLAGVLRLVAFDGAFEAFPQPHVPVSTEASPDALPQALAALFRRRRATLLVSLAHKDRICPALSECSSPVLPFPRPLPRPRGRGPEDATCHGQ